MKHHRSQIANLAFRSVVSVTVTYEGTSEASHGGSGGVAPQERGHRRQKTSMEGGAYCIIRRLIYEGIRINLAKRTRRGWPSTIWLALVRMRLLPPTVLQTKPMKRYKLLANDAQFGVHIQGHISSSSYCLAIPNTPTRLSTLFVSSHSFLTLIENIPYSSFLSSIPSSSRICFTSLRYALYSQKYNYYILSTSCSRTLESERSFICCQTLGFSPLCPYPRSRRTSPVLRRDSSALGDLLSF
jgi:hypothetical protein